MNYTEMLDLITEKMMYFNQNDPKRIQHFIKVHRLHNSLGERNIWTPIRSSLPNVRHWFTISAFGQQRKNMATARENCRNRKAPRMPAECWRTYPWMRRTLNGSCYLVAHHHTYTDMDGIDYQILVEADFLVNFYEDGLSTEAIQSAMEKIFRTDAGKALCRISYMKG